MSDPTNPYPPPVNDLEFTPSSDDRNLALIAHLSGLVGLFTGGYLGFVGPLVIYLMKKDSSPYVETQAKEALNFQITMFLIAIVCGVLIAVSCGMLFPLIFVPMLMQVIFGIIAALAVKDGQHYEYPVNWRLIQ